MRDQVIELGAETKRIHIINFGIDSARFSPPPSAESPNPARPPMVISLRNFEPVYDIRTLLRAIPLVLRTHPASRFTVVGRGSLAEELKAQARQLGIDAVVQFLGFVPNDQLPNLLRSADVYVSTSLSDAGIAASTAEAMACGRAVVITDSGENGKWIRDGVDGFLVPVGQPEVLAERINLLLGDQALRQSFGVAARNVIKERNDYKTEMTKMQTLYQTLVIPAQTRYTT
jgi:glycosyltransferase involved in cell wall biosynthesis